MSNGHDSKLSAARILRAIMAGVAIGYCLQGFAALAIGYTPRQAMIPYEPWRIRDAMTPRDPWAVEIAARAKDAADAERIVTESITYQVSADVWGCERIPTIAETRAAGWRGDCKAIAVALGSVLEAKGIEFSVNASYDHAWIVAEEGAR